MFDSHSVVSSTIQGGNARVRSAGRHARSQDPQVRPKVWPKLGDWTVEVTGDAIQELYSHYVREASPARLQAYVDQPAEFYRSYLNTTLQANLTHETIVMRTDIDALATAWDIFEIFAVLYNQNGVPPDEATVVQSLLRDESYMPYWNTESGQRDLWVLASATRQVLAAPPAAFTAGGVIHSLGGADRGPLIAHETLHAYSNPGLGSSGLREGITELLLTRMVAHLTGEQYPGMGLFYQSFRAIAKALWEAGYHHELKQFYFQRNTAAIRGALSDDRWYAINWCLDEFRRTSNQAQYESFAVQIAQRDDWKTIQGLPSKLRNVPSDERVQMDAVNAAIPPSSQQAVRDNGLPHN